jgi:hypothetical protein
MKMQIFLSEYRANAVGCIELRITQEKKTKPDDEDSQRAQLSCMFAEADQTSNIA